MGAEAAVWTQRVIAAADSGVGAAAALLLCGASPRNSSLEKDDFLNNKLNGALRFANSGVGISRTCLLL